MEFLLFFCKRLCTFRDVVRRKLNVCDDIHIVQVAMVTHLKCDPGICTQLSSNLDNFLKLPSCQVTGPDVPNFTGSDQVVHRANHFGK